MKTRGARARWAASPEGIAEAERLAAEEKAELDREAAAAAAAALRRDAVRTGDAPLPGARRRRAHQEEVQGAVARRRAPRPALPARGDVLAWLNSSSLNSITH